MPTTTTTHINRDGDARALLDFYAEATGGQVVALTYRDAQWPLDEEHLDRVMWGEVRTEGGFHVMAFDVRPEQAYDAGSIPFFVSLRNDTEEECRVLWEGLAAGGTVVQDLGPAPWSPLYGMVSDRFGVTWVLDVAVAY